MLGGHHQTDEDPQMTERERLVRTESNSSMHVNGGEEDNINHYTPYDDGVDLSHKFNLWQPLEPGLSEQERRTIARKRVQRIFKLPLTFKKPLHHEEGIPNINITPTPTSSAAEEIKRFQIKRPAGNFLIADYNKTQIQVKCQKDFEGAERPDWSVVRWIHMDKIDESSLPVLKANLPAPILKMMEDKITYQRLEVASYQNIFHEIHDIRRELQHLRARLVNISEAIDDVREIADREIESRAPVLAAASAFESQLSKGDSLKGKSVASSPYVERTGIFPHRLKLASIVRLQFKHLSSNVNQMAAQTTTLQEVCSWLADLVFQTLSQKMNQTMKTLTLISMIFIPLTFIVGVYGTNFEYLPELQWKYGYVFLWGLCIGVVVVELIMFKRLRWI